MSSLFKRMTGIPAVHRGRHGLVNSTRAAEFRARASDRIGTTESHLNEMDGARQGEPFDPRASRVGTGHGVWLWVHPRVARRGGLFLGSGTLEELHDSAVAFIGGNGHGRPPVQIPHMHIGPVREQNAHGGRLTFIGGDH